MATYSIQLNQRQRETLEKATKDLKSDYHLTHNRLDRLTIVNIDEILNALSKFKLSKMRLKTKQVEHMEMCYDCQNIALKLQDVRSLIVSINKQTATVANDDNVTSNDNEDEDSEVASND